MFVYELVCIDIPKTEVSVKRSRPATGMDKAFFLWNGLDRKVTTIIFVQITLSFYIIMKHSMTMWHISPCATNH